MTENTNPDKTQERTQEKTQEKTDDNSTENASAVSGGLFSSDTPAVPINTLVIGCGGLGCELLKILSHHREFVCTLIDFDTVDSTNLNRQFYFSPENVGDYKAQVLGEIFNYKYYTTRVQDVLNSDFISKYHIVFNCLDNNETRSYVNQMCYMFNIPLIDGGSAGWYGQTYVLGREIEHNREIPSAVVCECFDCLPKKVEVVFPICTIRDRPQNFRHCLAWAKTVVEDAHQELNSRNIKEDTSVNIKDTSVNKEDTSAVNSIQEEINHRNKSENGNNKRRKIESVKAEESGDIIIENTGKTEKIENASAVAEEWEKNKSDIFRQNLLMNKYQEIDLDQYITEVHGIKGDDINNGCINNISNSTDIMMSELLALHHLSLIYHLAVSRASRFHIPILSYLDSTTYINNIIPSICTTNSAVASLMILSYYNSMNYIFSNRVMSIELNGRNRECNTCGLGNYHIEYERGTTIGELYEKWNITEMITEEGVIEKYNNTGEIGEGTKSVNTLDGLNGSFARVTKRGVDMRVYFEIKEGIEGIKITRKR